MPAAPLATACHCDLPRTHPGASEAPFDTVSCLLTHSADDPGHSTQQDHGASDPSGMPILSVAGVDSSWHPSRLPAGPVISVSLCVLPDGAVAVRLEPSEASEWSCLATSAAASASPGRSQPVPSPAQTAARHPLASDACFSESAISLEMSDEARPGPMPKLTEGPAGNQHEGASTATAVVAAEAPAIGADAEADPEAAAATKEQMTEADAAAATVPGSAGEPEIARMDVDQDAGAEREPARELAEAAAATAAAVPDLAGESEIASIVVEEDAGTERDPARELAEAAGAALAAEPSERAAAGPFPWPLYLIGTRDCFTNHLVPISEQVHPCLPGSADLCLVLKMKASLRLDCPSQCSSLSQCYRRDWQQSQAQLMNISEYAKAHRDP